jgi:glycine oxidase
MPAADVVIVGGGAIGLSIAHALAVEGVRSVVLDRREPGREASWAGAGILSPAASTPGDPLSALRSLSARLHEQWAAQLREETGLDNGYRRCGGLDVAWNDAEARELDVSVALWQAEGIAFERLAAGDLARLEPAVSPDLHAAYHIPGRAQIRNPRHLRALAIAAQRRGVELQPHCGAAGFVSGGGRITALLTDEGELPCGTVIVAAGAWSGSLLAGLDLDVPTPPVKGQIVLLRPDRPLIGRIVEHGKNYLVPRDDGRILVGATEEQAGFDTRPTPVAIRDLLDFALRLCPALAGAELERSWAGLRPGNRDGRPTIGPAPGFENLWIATGHHRAGLQLSTGTARLLTDLVLARPPILDPAPFHPARPAEAPAADVFRS